MAIGAFSFWHFQQQTPSAQYKAEVLATLNSPALSDAIAQVPAAELHAQKYEACRGLNVLPRKSNASDTIGESHVADSMDVVFTAHEIEVNRQASFQIGEAVLQATERIGCDEFEAALAMERAGLN